jgi:hypothetical protein
VTNYATSSHAESVTAAVAAPSAGHHIAAVPEYIVNTGSNHGVPVMTGAGPVIVDHVVENIAPNFTGFGGDVDIHQAFQAMTGSGSVQSSSQKLDISTYIMFPSIEDNTKLIFL